MIYIHYYRHDELIKRKIFICNCKIRIFYFPPKNTMPLFIMNIPKENLFRQLDKQIVLCLQCTIVIHILYNRVLYMQSFRLFSSPKGNYPLFLKMMGICIFPLHCCTLYFRKDCLHVHF